MGVNTRHSHQILYPRTHIHLHTSSAQDNRLGCTRRHGHARGRSIDLNDVGRLNLRLEDLARLEARGNLELDDDLNVLRGAGALAVGAVEAAVACAIVRQRETLLGLLAYRLEGGTFVLPLLREARDRIPGPPEIVILLGLA